MIQVYGLLIQKFVYFAKYCLKKQLFMNHGFLRIHWIFQKSSLLVGLAAK
jgi:hypothetical protein